MHEPDDFELMERFRLGDRSALEVLVARHHASLLRYFQVQSRSRETAEDLAQEVWIRVIRHRRNYRPEAKFQTYLFAIARNLWIDRYRSLKAAPPHGLRGPGGGGGGGGDPPLDPAALPGARTFREGVRS